MAEQPPGASPDYTFRIVVAPAWDELQPPLAARATRLGLEWPAALAAHRVSAVYSLTLVGALGAGAPTMEVLAWEPPREHRLTTTSLAALDVGFGVGPRRALGAQPASTPEAVAALQVRLDAEGLFLAAHAPAAPAERLAPCPLATVLARFAAVARRELTLERRGSDHIVDRFAAPADLEDFAVTRWRGDAFYRLARPRLRLEVGLARGADAATTGQGR